MEDIRIGRSLASAARLVTLPNAAALQVVGPDPMRVRIVFSGDGNNDFWVAPLGLTPNSNQGLPCNVRIPTQIIRVEDYGKLVEGAWLAFSTALAGVLFVVESSLEKT